MIKIRKKKYIPHLAEFYFEPEFNWSHDEAYELYRKSEKDSYNKIFYKDCVGGMDLIEPESIDVIVADPPFGIDFSGKESIYNRNAENIVSDYKEVSMNYREFSLNWIKKLPKILKKTGSAFIVSGWTNLEYVLEAVRKANLELINHIIWKYQFGPFTSRKWVSSHYHIIWAVKNPKNYFYHRISHYNLDIWDDIQRTYKAREKKNGTKLPVELVQRMIDFTTKPGDVVFDPFMGNGTTAVAAKLNYRHFLGFELNNNMKSIIESNINQAKLGDMYIPYNERLESKEELAAKDGDYKNAYLKYCVDNNLPSNG